MRMFLSVSGNCNLKKEFGVRRMKKVKDKSQIRFAAAVLCIAGIAAATVVLYPFVEKLGDQNLLGSFQEWAGESAGKAFFTALGLQVLHIVIAFIPGEPVEILSGAMFGTWGGLGVCLLGCVIASVIVFYIARKLGMPILCKIFGKKGRRFRFLKESSQIESVTFLLFLIPGTPKDILTYLAGVSQISLTRFLWISTFARIPSIVTSTFVGANVQDGNFVLSALMFLATGIIGIIGIRYKDHMLHFCKTLGKNKA